MKATATQFQVRSILVKSEQALMIVGGGENT